MINYKSHVTGQVAVTDLSCVQLLRLCSFDLICAQLIFAMLSPMLAGQLEARFQNGLAGALYLGKSPNPRTA